MPVGLPGGPCSTTAWPARSLLPNGRTGPSFVVATKSGAPSPSRSSSASAFVSSGITMPERAGSTTSNAKPPRPRSHAPRPPSNRPVSGSGENEFCASSRSCAPSPSQSAMPIPNTGAIWLARGSGRTTKRAPRLSTTTCRSSLHVSSIRSASDSPWTSPWLPRVSPPCRASTTSDEPLPTKSLPWSRSGCDALAAYAVPRPRLPATRSMSPSPSRSPAATLFHWPRTSARPSASVRSTSRLPASLPNTRSGCHDAAITRSTKPSPSRSVHVAAVTMPSARTGSSPDASVKRPPPLRSSTLAGARGKRPGSTRLPTNRSTSPSPS